MFAKLESTGLFRFARVLSALLILLPTSTKCAGTNRTVDLKGSLPELQSAVGKDWLVTALPDGYLVMYAPLVSFYPAISESTKLDSRQRALHGRVDHLQIRITLLYPPSIQKVDQFNAFWRAVRPAPGYFECSAEDWAMWGGSLSTRQGHAPFHSSVLFSSNIAPDQLVSPLETVDVYEQTLDALAPLFGSARRSNLD